MGISLRNRLALANRLPMNASAGLFPLHSRIVFLGDSITAARGFAGFADWALFYTRGRYYPKVVGSNGTGPTGWNQGVVGNTEAQMYARRTNVVAETPKVVVHMGGCNDITAAGRTYAQIIADKRQTWDYLIANGSKVLATTIIPGDTSTVYIGAMETTRQQVNTWIMTQTDVNPVNLEPAITNTATQLSDGKHPNGTGAQAIGALVATKLASLISASEILYDPAAVPAENLYTNSTFAGGTTVATSWTFFQNTNGLTKAASKTTLDGYNVQKYVGSGTASANVADNFNQNVVVTGGLTGDLVEAWVEVNVVKATGMSGLAISAGTNNTASTHMSINSQDTAALAVPFRGVLRAPPSVLASDGQTFNSRLSILVANAAVCDIEVQFLRAGYRKVPASQ